MHRFFTFIFSILFATLTFAQASDDNTLKFLGIPIDGTRANMMEELKKKDFEYDADRDLLHGQFNGKVANVFISTNHGVVDRIYVVFEGMFDAATIKTEYNALMRQFNEKSKYISALNKPIPDDEDISVQMTVHGKVYQALYYLNPNYSPEQVAQYKSQWEKEGKKHDYEKGMALLEQVSIDTTGHVWFTIHRVLGGFGIGLYYDNLKNRPHGEDL